MKDETKIKLKSLVVVTFTFLFIYLICLIGVYIFTQELNWFLTLITTLTLLGSYFVASVYDHMVKMYLEELETLRKAKKEIEDYFKKFEE